MHAPFHLPGLAALGTALLAAFASAQGSLTTTFVSDNGRSSSGAGCLFDVDVKNPNGLKITSFDVNSMATASTIVDIDVYLTPTTYVGSDTNAAVWVKVASGSGPAVGRNSPTPINTSDFFLAPGKYGMYLVYSNAQSATSGPAYTNGTGSNQNYSNNDLALALGIGRSSPFGGTLFTPRVWNGTIYYAANDKAAHGGHGYGCMGSNNLVPTLDLSAEPVIGTTTNILVADMLANIGSGFVFFGLSGAQIDLAVVGMPGCVLFHNVLLTVGFANVNGTASIPGPIPNDNALVGGILRLQAASTDAAANTLGLVASNGLVLRIGKP